MDTAAADNAALADLSRWIAERTLAGDAETRMLEGVCERLVRLGIVLKRVLIGADTLHPVLEGRVFEWHRDQQDVKEVEYGPATSHWFRRRAGCAALSIICSRLARPRSGSACRRTRRTIRSFRYWPNSRPWHDRLCRLSPTASAAPWSWARWMPSFRPGPRIVPADFSDSDLAALDYIVPAVASSILGASLGRIAGTLVETYLGRDAGRRVLRGTINRGVAERLHTVLWFSDLKGFTRLVDTVASEQIIPLLNDYADAIVSSIHEHEGQVLKFIGDGLLATFEARDPAAACGRALEAARAALHRVETVNAERTPRQLPVTGFYLALHVGDVFYGNIGSAERLDFTVIGPAVNEVSRIAGMSRSLDQDILLSSAFAGAAGDARDATGVARPLCAPRHSPAAGAVHARSFGLTEPLRRDRAGTVPPPRPASARRSVRRSPAPNRRPASSPAVRGPY